MEKLNVDTLVFVGRGFIVTKKGKVVRNHLLGERQLRKDSRGDISGRY